MLAHGRRQKIRAPRKATSNVDFDTLWNNRLAPAIKEIQNKNSSELSFETLYSTVYSLVLAKHGKILYDTIQKTIKTRLDEEVIPTIGAKLLESNPINVLKEIQRIWQDHCLSSRLISDIVMYLDRVYSRDSQVALVYDSSLLIFRDALLRTPKYPIAKFIYQTIVDHMQKERGGEIIDSQTLKATVGMLESLPWGDSINSASIYSVEFEPLLDSASRDYYQKVARNLVSQCDIGTYLHKVKQLLDEEARRDSMYLPEVTCQLLLPTVQVALILDVIKEVINNPNHGFSYICDEKRYDDLSLLYEMVGLVDKSHDCIQKALAAKVLATGKDINDMSQKLTEEARLAKAEGSKKENKKEKPTTAKVTMNSTAVAIKWVVDMLEFRKQYKKIQHDCFQGDKQIEKVLDDSISKAVNDNSKVSEYLSLFIDDVLKKSMKGNGQSDSEFEVVLDDAIQIFKFIADKDIFENYYKNHLAKRLLSGKTSEDSEKYFVAQMKQEVGTSFTNKMEGMFRDMRISKERMTQFRDMQKNLSPEDQLPFDLNVKVLTSGHWPSSISNNLPTCRLPPFMEAAQQTYKEFYLSKHNMRVFFWNLTFGTVDVRARFKKRTHEINMHVMAAAILLLFNGLEDGASLTYEDIKNKTDIADNELKRHLLSISVAPRTRLLVKEPMSRDVKPTDKFKINDKFESPMVKLKVLVISATNKVETDQERKTTLDKAKETRKFEIDAAVVRVMKTRKTMEHALLIAEVTKQLSSRFRPDPSAIKHQIDSLMDREYLERDPEQRNVYRYLA